MAHSEAHSAHGGKLPLGKGTSGKNKSPVHTATRRPVGPESIASPPTQSARTPTISGSGTHVAVGRPVQSGNVGEVQPATLTASSAKTGTLRIVGGPTRIS